MKFEMLHPDSVSGFIAEFESSVIRKTNDIKSCSCCGSTTRWMDVIFNGPICGEECNRMMWTGFSENSDGSDFSIAANEKRNQIGLDLKWGELQKESSKDIIIIVHDQLRYIRECLESIRENTRNYQIYIWDNGSSDETKEYLEEAFKASQGKDGQITLVRSSSNDGFIKPNNELASMGNGEYIILLNSDTHVFSNWSNVMVGCLQNRPNTLQVGYLGGCLDENAFGCKGNLGSNIDYVCGWCFAINRDTYEKYGLFNDKELKFAYCEDSDFSLRLKEAGHEVYALYPPLVYHYGNKTIEVVSQERDCKVTLNDNHEYMKNRWSYYLENDRVLREKNE